MRDSSVALAAFPTQLVPRGIYRVGNAVFESKIEALIEAGKTNTTPTWDFHDAFFSQFDWTQEPSKDLKYYYLQRCQQIRDEYQYLVLHYSGGSDSHNILSHFYQAGLHIDQINVTVPLEYYDRHTQVTQDRASKNLHNEWYHVIQPDLDWVRTHMPDTKITVYDSTRDILNFQVDQDWILYAGEHCNPNVAGRFRYYDVVDAGIYDRLRVGHIYGVDKPRVFQSDGKWYFAFLDSVLGIQSSYRPVWLKEDHINVINFYWSPDLPDLLIKQSHLIKQYYEQHPTHAHLSVHRRLTPDEHEIQQNIIKSVVYPNWRDDIFQARKANNVFFKEFDQWFFTFADQSAKSRWQEGYRYITQCIDHKWMNLDHQNNPTSLSGFWSKWHQIS